MNTQELAADIGAIQAGIATGDLNNNTVQEALNDLRKKALGLTGEQVEESIIMGYRRDAIEQVMMLANLVKGTDMPTIPDSALFHLSACADMFTGKVYTYFKLRNQRVATDLRTGGEVDNGQ